MMCLIFNSNLLLICGSKLSINKAFLILRLPKLLTILIEKYYVYFSIWLDIYGMVMHMCWDVL